MLPGMTTRSETGLATIDAILSAGEGVGRIYTKSAGGPIISIGTFPTHDSAGDYVEPGRGNWGAYTIPFGQPGSVFGPVANWSHRCPIGRGEVTVQQLQHDGMVTPVEVMKTEFFTKAIDTEGIDLRRRDPRTSRSWDKERPFTVDEVLRVAAQAEVLVRDDIATGVSVEFAVNPERKGSAPGEGDYWDLDNDSLLEQRKARHFRNWYGVGYAHARTPVNPGCMTLEGQSTNLRTTELSESIEKAIRVAQTGRLPNGEVACEIIIKAFSDLKDYRSRGMVLLDTQPPTDTTQTPPPEPAPASPAAPPVPQNVVTPPVAPATAPITSPSGVTPAATTPTPTPAPASAPVQAPVIVKSHYDYYPPNVLTELPSRGCRALYNTAQGLIDLARCLESDGGESDDLSVRKFSAKGAAALKDLASTYKARAEKLKAKLSGAESDEDWDDEDADLSIEEKAVECADDGAIIIKSFPDWKPRRMTFANLVPTPSTPAVPSASGEATISAEEQAILDAQMQVLNKAIRKKTRMAKELMEAGIANGRI